MYFKFIKDFKLAIVNVNRTGTLYVCTLSTRMTLMRFIYGKVLTIIIFKKDIRRSDT